MYMVNLSSLSSIALSLASVSGVFAFACFDFTASQSSGLKHSYRW